MSFRLPSRGTMAKHAALRAVPVRDVSDCSSATSSDEETEPSAIARKQSMPVPAGAGQLRRSQSMHVVHVARSLELSKRPAMPPTSTPKDGDLGSRFRRHSHIATAQVPAAVHGQPGLKRCASGLSSTQSRTELRNQKLADSMKAVEDKVLVRNENRSRPVVQAKRWMELTVTANSITFLGFVLHTALRKRKEASAMSVLRKLLLPVVWLWRYRKVNQAQAKVLSSIYNFASKKRTQKKPQAAWLIRNFLTGKLSFFAFAIRRLRSRMVTLQAAARLLIKRRKAQAQLCLLQVRRVEKEIAATDPLPELIVLRVARDLARERALAFHKEFIRRDHLATLAGPRGSRPYRMQMVAGGKLRCGAVFTAEEVNWVMGEAAAYMDQFSAGSPRRLRAPLASLTFQRANDASPEARVYNSPSFMAKLRQRASMSSQRNDIGKENFELLSSFVSVDPGSPQT